MLSPFYWVCSIVLLGCLVLSAPTDEHHDESHAAPAHTITTKQGPIEGVSDHGVTGKAVVAYYGIPYAQPPLGENRFRPPLPIEETHEEVFQAKIKPLPCYQNINNKIRKLARKFGTAIRGPFTEDCLNLNVWVPEVVPEHASTIVMLNYGTLVSGSSVYPQDGATLASEENVIVVTFNSRLGVFGFLTLGNDDAPGNAGLMDQQLALKWVHENIEAFGGDPGKVTVLGHGGGAVSVGYHVLAPGSQGLFQRAILMSGTPTCRWGNFNKAAVIKKSRKVAKFLGYRGAENPEEILNFLQHQDAQDMIDANDYCNFINEPDFIGPTVDGVFIEDNPHHLLDKVANNSKIEILIGTTSDEGTAFMIKGNPELFHRYPDGGINKEELGTVIRNLDHHVMDHLVTDAVVNNYIDRTRTGDPHMYRDKARLAVSDYIVNCDVEEFADHFAENKDHHVYRYIFDGKPPISSRYTPKWAGALHNSDAPAVTGFYLGSENITEEYKTFVHEVMDHFVNFAKTGDPNLSNDEAQSGVHWPKYDLNHRSVMVLRPQHNEIQEHPGVETCAILRHLVPLVSKVEHCRRGEHHDGVEADVEGHHSHRE